VAGSAVLVPWLTRGPVGRFPRAWSAHPPYLLLGAAGIMIWLPYALHALGFARAGAVADDSWGIEHWPVQGAAGLAVAACVWPWRPEPGS
jgi:hypothetical protein